MVHDTAKKCRILVVDDNLDFVELLAYTLRQMGHEVSFAINGAAALEAAPTLCPQLVLLDMDLPDLDGCVVARRLKQRVAEARIVALTGRSGDEHRRRSLEAGCEQHIVKPVDERVIQGIVEVFC